MYNNTGIKKETYGNRNQLLFAVEHQVSMSVVVDETAFTVTENGRKIAKAGTPVTGSLDARDTAFTPAVTASNASNAVGILLHDVDVTDGDNNGTLLLHGFVNTNRIDATTKAKITAEVKKALPLIVFAAC
nr:MAG TPA: Head decoration protein [Caudoviricetes sp.]